MYKESKYFIVSVTSAIILFIFVSGIIIMIYSVIKDTQATTPVEEMYHRQLVVTLDSILDARFGPGCCEEDIDTVNANTFSTRFGGNLLPME